MSKRKYLSAYKSYVSFVSALYSIGLTVNTVHVHMENIT